MFFHGPFIPGMFLFVCEPALWPPQPPPPQTPLTEGLSALLNACWWWEKKEGYEEDKYFVLPNHLEIFWQLIVWPRKRSSTSTAVIGEVTVTADMDTEQTISVLFFNCEHLFYRLKRQTIFYSFTAVKTPTVFDWFDLFLHKLLVISKSVSSAAHTFNRFIMLSPNSMMADLFMSSELQTNNPWWKDRDARPPSLHRLLEITLNFTGRMPAIHAFTHLCVCVSVCPCVCVCKNYDFCFTSLFMRVHSSPASQLHVGSDVVTEASLCLFAVSIYTPCMMCSVQLDGNVS